MKDYKAIEGLQDNVRVEVKAAYDKGYKQGFKDGEKSYFIRLKTREFEEEQNADEEIKIGDEVETDPEKENRYVRFVVCGIDKNRNLTGFSKDGHWSCWAEYYCRKTGRHFDQIEQVFEAMKESEKHD